MFSINTTLFPTQYSEASLIKNFIFFFFFSSLTENTESHIGCGLCGLNWSLIWMCLACGSNFMSSLVFLQASLLKVHFQNFAWFLSLFRRQFSGYAGEVRHNNYNPEGFFSFIRSTWRKLYHIFKIKYLVILTKQWLPNFLSQQTTADFQNFLCKLPRFSKSSAENISY